MNFFDSRHKKLHNKPEQIARQYRALDVVVYDIDYTGQVGFINDYHVTLEDCTCPDFQYNQKGKKPCKHMYRLAMELGLFPYPVLSTSSSSFIDESVIDDSKKEADFIVIDNQVAMTQQAVSKLLNITISDLRMASFNVGITNSGNDGIYEINGKYYYLTPAIIFKVQKTYIKITDIKTAKISSGELYMAFREAEDKLLPAEFVKAKREKENRQLAILGILILIVILLIYLASR